MDTVGHYILSPLRNSGHLSQSASCDGTLAQAVSAARGMLGGGKTWKGHVWQVTILDATGDYALEAGNVTSDGFTPA